MNDNNKNSRVDKFEKRRKNTKLLSIMLVIGGILIVVLIAMFIFGGDDGTKQQDEQANKNEEQAGESDYDNKTDDSISEDNETVADEEDTSDDSETDSDNNENVETKEIETPDDDNVVKAYTADWQPIGTEQQGPHTTNYDEGSQDRNEIEEAIRLATGLEEGNMTTWWLERGGDQEVIATVSNNDDTETYRTYISWVENEGWQPTKVEVLKENDQKYRFE